MEDDDAMVIENVGVEGPVDQFGGGLGAVGVATGTGQGPVRPYRRLGDVPRVVKPESTEGGPWGQPLKQPEGAPLNLG